jgi:hypothetical protein
MKMWSRIKQLNPKQMFWLSVAFIKNPSFIRPTLSATNETMKICKERFGLRHHSSNNTNAFRHALWNILICLKTLKNTQNREESSIWAEKITNLYEKVTKNTILDQVMDLHNNRVGRSVFISTFGQEIPEILDLLNEMTQKAQKIANIEEIKNFENSLVYIDDI